MMTSKLKTTLCTLTFAIAVLSLTSCDDSEDSNYYYYGPYYDFADIKSFDGSTVYYTAMAPNGNEVVDLCSYQADFVDDEEMKPGTRVYMSYSLTSEVTSPDPDVIAVQLMAIERACMAGVTVELPENVEAVKFYVNTLPFRTGRYVNLTTTIAKADGREFICYLDPSTAHSDNPQLYLRATADKPQAERADKVESVMYPVSINLDQLWSMTSADRVTLNIATTDNQAPISYEIKK